MTSTLRRAEARSTLRAAASALRMGFDQTLAGWPVLAGRCLFFGLIMTVLSALWDKVAAEQVAGAIALPPGGVVLYVGATEWITLSLPAVYLRFEDDIRSGGLEIHLLRPKPYLLQTLALGLGGGLARLAALGVTAILLLALSGRAWPPLEGLAFLLVLGPLGLLVGVMLYALAGLAAFWARRTLPFQLIIQKLMFLLGGLFAPVTLYPAALAEVARASPFAAHLYWAGAQVMAPSLMGFLVGAGWQLAWILLLGAACLGLWRLGLAKLLREGTI
ncbi:ABC-2 family transporter protein [Phenylobacterium aquaticum]|uniref:ABC-2 family transporter protein n=1 Tax=Phenylobacterium aquaticum TaxID=1763816 RepID=UPI0026E9C174|nr:ABC-2 family transporter protein [Phenylobacterium aquaticum]